MNYIIFDLEFNQGYESINPGCPFEIIQFGAVKLDEKLKKISTFNYFIKPCIYKEINPYVQRITGITLNMLDNAKPFEQVYEEFLEISRDCVLGIWGMSDLKELLRNIKYYSLNISSFSKEYINIQQYASKYLFCPKGTQIGLEKAIKFLSIPLENQLHDALNDALYTAKVFKKIFNNNIIPIEYNFQNHRIRQKNKNAKVDYVKLIKQFEKMNGRELTEEEKSMIKLAYVMGRTNQFQLEIKATEKR